MRLRGPQIRSGRRAEEKILDPTGTRLQPLGRPARSRRYTDYSILNLGYIN
jgi:hypothetical protein